MTGETRNRSARHSVLHAVSDAGRHRLGALLAQIMFFHLPGSPRRAVAQGVLDTVANGVDTELSIRNRLNDVIDDQASHRISGRKIPPRGFEVCGSVLPEPVGLS